jgi:formylmethanofuran dehydrogenase subunit D
MRRSLRRRVRRARAISLSLLPFLPLLFFFLSVAGSAQTIRRGPSARAHRVHHPDLSDSENVEFSSGDWSQLGRLQQWRPDFICCSEFGGSVGISGGTIVVGDTAYPFTVGGSIFLKPMSGWKNMVPSAKLLAPLAGPYFATSCLAIDGDTIVAGTGSGVAYVYAKPEGGWTDMYPTAILSTGGVDFTFGLSVSISGDTIVVGDEGNNAFTGAVYVFVKPESGWHDMAPTATLTASDGQPTDSFGAAVSISGKTVAVGATQYNSAGKAYVFVEPPAGWANMTQTAELRATDAPNGAEVGFSISTSNDDVLVGSRGRYDPVGAYMFVKPKGGWSDMTETAKLSAADPRV